MGILNVCVGMGLLCLVHASVHAEETCDDAGLSDGLRNHVKKLSRPIYTYHYATATGMGLKPDRPLDMNDVRVSRHVQSWAKTYLEKPGFGEVNSDIKGFYVALDPLASREFGGKNDDWVLYRVELPASMPYLDVTVPDEKGPYEAVPANMVLRLQRAGCTRARPPTPPVIFSYVDLFKQNQGLRCRELANCALKKLKVKAIKYPYAATKFPDCSGTDESSYIVIDAENLTPDQIAIFSKDTPDSGPWGGEKLLIEKLFVETKYDALSLPRGGRLWPEKDQIPVAGLEQWKRLHLANCRVPSDPVPSCADNSSTLPLSPEKAGILDSAKELTKPVN